MSQQIEETQSTETLEVQIAKATLVQVVMPSGVVEVYERPIHAEVAAVGPQGAAGPAGVNGLPGPPGQSAILGTWEGAWSPAVQYPHLGLVQHQGSTYLNNSGFLSPLGVPPPSPPWELIAAKGEDLAPFMYTHVQMNPDAVWTIVHGLNGFPNVTAIDSSDSEIVGDLDYIDSNTVQITFASATAGKAYVS